MTNEDIAELVLVLRAEIEKMSDMDRVDVISVLMDGFCTNCGESTPCCCRRHD